MANVNDLTQLINQEVLVEEITEEGDLKEVVGGAVGDGYLVVAPLPVVGGLQIGPIAAPLGPVVVGLVAPVLATLNAGGGGLASS